MLLQKGQKIKLGDIGIQNTFTVECALTSPFVIDVTCFGVNKENKLIDDRYMVFYNVKSSPGNEIKLIQESPSFKFDINTSNLPAHIEKLVFTAAIDGAENMSTLGKLQFKLGSAELTLTGSDFKLEKAIIIAEVYQKDGIWRLGAVGQGFNGGLDALLTYFGGQQADPVEQKSVPSMQSVKPEQQAKKVFLEKRVNLTIGLSSIAII